MTQLTDRVLVGVDTPTDSRHLVRVAAELAAALGAELHLVHVRLTRAAVQGRPMTRAQRETGEVEGCELLDGLRREAQDKGVPVADTHLRFGERIETELVAAQQELAAGLLVVGSRREASVARRLLSTPASAAVRRSPGSVLVVREPASGDGDRL